MEYKKSSIWDVLNDYTIKIPLIQRDYIYGVDTNKISMTRNRLLKEILKEYKDGNKDLGFVYGTSNNSCFEPLDGQQRLTTLWLLINLLNCMILIKTEDDNVKDELKKDKEILKKFEYQVRVTTENFVKFLNKNVFCSISEKVERDDNEDDYAIIKQTKKLIEKGYAKKIIELNKEEEILKIIEEIKSELKINIIFSEIKKIKDEKRDGNKINQMEKYLYFKIVKNNKDYHLEYDSDVNVMSMLSVLYEWLKELETSKMLFNNEKLNECYVRLKKSDNIYFQFMVIRDVAEYVDDHSNEKYLLNNDDVYIKLNGRGLWLTPLENIKAMIMSEFEKNTKKEIINHVKEKYNDYIKNTNKLVFGNSNNECLDITSYDTLYKSMIEKISEIIDVDFEDSLFKEIKNQSGQAQIGKLIDSKRMNFFMNIFLYEYISVVAENSENYNGNQRDIIRELIDKITYKTQIYKINENEAKLLKEIQERFSNDFTTFPNLIKDFIKDKDGFNNYLIEDTIIDSLIIYNIIFSSKTNVTIDLKDKLLDKYKIDNIEIEELVSLVHFVIRSKKYLKDFKEFYDFIKRLLADESINGNEEVIYCFKHINRFVNNSNKFCDNILIESEKDISDNNRFNFNYALKYNYISEYHKMKLKREIDDWNTNNNNKNQIKWIDFFDKLEKDFGSHYSFVFEFFGCITQCKVNDKVYYEFNAKNFVKTYIDKNNSTIINQNNFDKLKNYIKNSSTGLELYDDSNFLIYLIKNGFVLDKKGYEDKCISDDKYFINNNKFNRNPMTATYLLRCYHVDDDAKVFNMRKHIYDYVKNIPNTVSTNISSEITKMTIKDDNFFEKVICECDKYIPSYKDYRIRKCNSADKNYYVITNNGVFSGINMIYI